jgi:uncharacterized membrane protein YfcA
VVAARGVSVDAGLLIGFGVVAAVAAILGSMLGLGGGVFLVPILTLFFGVDQKVAIGASAVAVVTNSVVGSSVHVRSGFTNLRLAVLLQVTTAAGATAGALFGVGADPAIVSAVFGAVLLYAAISMLLRGDKRPTAGGVATPAGDPAPTRAPPAVPADRWRLDDSFLDPATGGTVRYAPRRLPLGLGVSVGAGVISGMLGVGGGVVMVPAMNLAMAVPVKAAVGTSAFMVGITSVATAFVFYSQGEIDPTVVVPAVVGVLLGGQFGSRLTRRLRAQRLAALFSAILFYLGLSLLLQAFGVTLPGQR